MRRSSSLYNNTGVALSREIASKYDDVAVVANNIQDIEDIGTAISDGKLDEWVELKNAQVVTGPAGSDVTWDGTTLIIPKGDKGEIGPKGDSGFTPVYEFSYENGNLVYELVNYEDSVNEVREW